MAGTTLAGFDLARTRRYGWLAAVVLFKGVLTGSIVGIHTFLYYQHHIAPGYFEQWYALAIIVLVSAAVVVIQGTLRRGMAISFVALFVGFAIHAAAWVSPLFAAGFDPTVAEILLPRFSGRGFLSALWFVPFAYAGGYFTALTIVGYWFE